MKKDAMAVILEKILKTEQFSIQGLEMVWRAVKEFRKTGAGFADCLLAQINLANGCAHTMTLDSKAARSAGYRLLGP